ncbi:MAG: hypothetical protein ACPGAO_06085 [Flavobacteriaceae bacterium]
MKTIFKKLSVVFLALIVFACETENTVIDDVFDTVQNGAILRQVSTAGAIDLYNTASTVSVTLEYQDAEGSTLLSNVSVFLSFVDKNGTDDSFSNVPLGTIEASEFSPSIYNLPEATFTYSFAQALAAGGLNQGQINGGDQFVLNFQLNLSDGRSYGSANVNGNVAAVGGYYSSPYRLANNVVCLPPEGFAVGTYSFITDAPQMFGGAYGDTFSTEVNIVATGPTTRQFITDYLGFGLERTFDFDLVCGDVLVPPGQGSGLACGGNPLEWGPASDGSTGAFDGNDDSSFTIVIDNNTNDACGASATLHNFVLTKL